MEELADRLYRPTPRRGIFCGQGARLVIHRTLISAESLHALLGDARLRLFDCRFDLMRPDDGRARYEAGHLEGAFYAHLNRDLSASPTPGSGRHPLPEPEVFEARLRSWGVNSDSQVVAYDDTGGMYASRLWWMLRWLGHEAVAVLDGGLRRWMQLGLPLTGDLPLPGPGNFTARPRHSLAADAREVLAAASDARRVVLDARAPERYRGEVEPIDAVAGHVPGARNHPFALNLDPEGRFLAPEALRLAFAPSLRGVPVAGVVAMCGSGVTACHLLLALEHAGLTGARLYPGSWSEWACDPSRPVRTGPDP
jgi:thiosulfate/3-mercaptopyruvate sulfurtransferase